MFFSVYTSAYVNWNTLLGRVIHSGGMCSSLTNLKSSDLKLRVWKRWKALEEKKKKKKFLPL